MYSYVCLSFVIASTLWREAPQLPLGPFNGWESSTGRPCLTAEVHDNSRHCRAFTLTFPLVWHWWGFMLCKLAACFLKSAKGHWSQRLAQREWGQPKMLLESLVAGLTPDSTALHRLPHHSDFPLTFHGKGRADNRRPRPYKGFCSPYLSGVLVTVRRCGCWKQGLSLCHLTSFVTLCKLFFNCSFLINNHKIMTWDHKEL